MNTDNLNEALNWNNLNYFNSANIPGNCYVWQALGTPKSKTNFHPRNIQQAGKWATCQYYNSLFIKLEKRRCTWNYEVAFRSFLPIHVISLGSSALRSMIQPLFTCLSFLGTKVDFATRLERHSTLIYHSGTFYKGKKTGRSDRKRGEGVGGELLRRRSEWFLFWSRLAGKVQKERSSPELRSYPASEVGPVQQTGFPICSASDSPRRLGRLPKSKAAVRPRAYALD